LIFSDLAFYNLKWFYMKEIFENSPLSDENIEALLWDYIDGIGEVSERSAIQMLVDENAIWREKYSELLVLHQMIQSSELEEPSMRFTKNIMEEISRLHIAPAAKSYINKKVIWGIGGSFITMIIGFLIYAIAQINWSEGTANNSIGIDLSKLDYSRIFSNNFINVFMMLNVVLGLLFFDRYLADKRNKLIKKA
jgi:regulatory protein YycI of two-component signal transduction system YycFG